MKAMMNWRYHVLFIVGAIAILGIFSTPADDAKSWWLALVASKSIGIVAAWLWYRMFKLWDERNEIPEMSNLAKDE